MAHRISCEVAVILVQFHSKLEWWGPCCEHHNEFSSSVRGREHADNLNTISVSRSTLFHEVRSLVRNKFFPASDVTSVSCLGENCCVNIAECPYLFIIIYHIPSIKSHLGWMFTQHVSTSTVSSSGLSLFMLQTKHHLKVIIALWTFNMFINFCGEPSYK
jgi:hypothetical protein